ncbi:MAG: CAP domain-containing protein [Acidimicrobiales bacterium]
MRRGETGGLGRRGQIALGWLLGGVVAVVALVVSSAPGVDASARLAATNLTTPTSTTAAPAPTTTVPPTPTTTAPPVHVAPAPAPKPAASAVPATQKRGILPPAVPPQNIPPSPDFLQSCQGTQYDDSATCVDATLSAIDNARAREGLPAMALPSNWAQLSVQQQLYVSTNLERTVRGLPPLTAMATALDQASAQGAARSTDPSPPSGFPFTQWGSNWAGAVGNPLEAVYYWMYDDGLGSSNIDCTQSNQSGCWGHRQNVLLNLTCTVCVMGTGYVPNGWNNDPSLAELLVDTSGQPAEEFTWSQELAYF